MNRCEAFNNTTKQACSIITDPYQTAWKDLVATVQANQGITYTDTTSTAGSFSSSVRSFGMKCALTDTGEFYLAPWYFTSLMSFNPTTSEFTTRGTISSVAGATREALFANNGCIYYLPANYNGIIKYNIATGDITTIGSNVIYNYTGLVYGDYIYAVTFAKSRVLKLDTRDDSYQFIDTGLGNAGWYGLTWAPDGCFYGAPHGTNASSCVLKIDPKDDSINTIGTFSQNHLFSKGTLASNGCIYCVPITGASSILKINPSEGTADLVGSLGSTSYRWHAGMLAPNGSIYYTNDSAVTSILKINPLDNDSYSSFGSFRQSGWGSFAVCDDGKLYAPPDWSTNMLILDPGSSVMKRNFKRSTILLLMN